MLPRGAWNPDQAAVTVAAVAAVATIFVLVPWGAVPRIAPASPEIFDPALRETTAAYAIAKYAFWGTSTILRWGALAGIVALGGSATLAAAARRITGDRPLAARFVATALLLVLLAIALLPVTLTGGHEIDRTYGVSNRSDAAWLADWAKANAVWIPLYAALAAGFLTCLDRWPRRGWIVAAAGGVGVAVVGTFIAPRAIDPLFRDFAPLEDAALESEIRAMGERAGVDIGRIRVMDASRRTRRMNAYVTGLGATRQVVLYDTLLDGAPREEVLQVVAHEIAHAARNHVERGLLLTLPWIALGIAALAALARWRARRAGSAPGDPASIPLLWLAVSVGLFLSSPVSSALSRAMEAEADWIALGLTRDPDTFVELRRRVVRANLAPVEPPGWTVLWFSSHPPVLDRIGMAGFWRERHGEP